MRQRPTIAELEAKANLEKAAEPEKDVERQEPKVEQESGKRASKPKKKRFKIRYFAGFMVLVAVAAALFAYKTGMFDHIIKKYSSDDDNLDKDTTIAADLPLTESNGIVGITFPLIDQTLGKTDGNYSTIEGYTLCEIRGNEISIADLTKVGNNGNGVDYYQSANGEEPVGHIGVLPEYAEFIMSMNDLKAKILARDESVTAALEPNGYEVPDLYVLPAGYTLYSEDATALSSVKIAYKFKGDDGKEDGRVMYYIPQYAIDKIIGITPQNIELIGKYEVLKSQIISVYSQYRVANEPIEANNEETENRGR